MTNANSSAWNWYDFQLTEGLVEDEKHFSALLWNLLSPSKKIITQFFLIGWYSYLPAYTLHALNRPNDSLLIFFCSYNYQILNL